MAFNEECILHVACRMVFSEVHRREYMPVVFHFRTVGDGKSHAAEYIYDFILYNAQRMTCTQVDRVGSTSEVKFCGTVVLHLESFFQSCYTFLCTVFQLVQFHSHFLLLFCCHISEVSHQCIDSPLLTKVFYSQSFQFFCIRSL